MDATVTTCHSRTNDLPGHCRRADIIIAAIGRAEMVRACVSCRALGVQMCPHIQANRTHHVPSGCYGRQTTCGVAHRGRQQDGSVKADWIKPGATVIDVGVNSKPAPDDKRGYKLCGDVDFEGARHVAGAITPVPGGDAAPVDARSRASKHLVVV
eukprot:scaffold318872_cov33-Tisochrysis_lutea.AAC.3